MATRAENRAYVDAQVRRRIRERRTIAGIVAGVLATLEAADRDLAEYLRIRLASMVGRSPADVADALDRVMREVTTRRRETLAAIRKELRAAMSTIAVGQPAAERDTLRKALGEVEREIAEPERDEVAALLAALPFAVSVDRAGTLTDVLENLRRADIAALRQTILAGLSAGDNLDALMRRIAGSRSRRFTDGELANTRRGLTAVADAALSHAAALGTAAFWGANASVFDTVLRWTDMLDERVCPLCRARSGKFTTAFGGPLPAGLPPLRPRTARPPAHLKCRCFMLALLPGEIPVIPAYPDWLREQPAEVQDEILGQRKAELFRSGKVRIDAFVDDRGRAIPLDQLNG